MSDGPGELEPAGADSVRRWARETPGTARARSTVRGVLAFQLLANGLGLSVILLYVSFLFPPGNSDHESSLNLRVFGVYLAINVIIGLPVNLLLLRRAVVWVREGTEATARQRWLVLRLPLLETITALVSWFGGAILFGIINSSSRRVSVGIALAGVVTCTLLYLLLEGHFRPVFALALRNRDLPENRRDVMPRLMLAWLLGSGMPIALLGVAPLLDRRFEITRLPWIAAFGLLGGGAVMAAAAISVSRPLNRLRGVLREVEQGELEIEVPVDDLGELGRLAEGINDLVAGLREREQLRDLFGRQVGQAALADVSGTGDHFDADGEQRDVTVMFVDLQGYTRFSEHSSPEEVVTMLNRFFRVVVAAVNREGGWVNKFEGDAALCVFGAPQPDDDHAGNALRAAVSLHRDLARLEGMLPAGIGVATGSVVAGFIGTPERFEYTVIGDCVNLASRLCDLAKNERSGMLASIDAWAAGGRPDGWTEVGRVKIRGRSQRTGAVTLAVPRPRRRR
ncbi:MAG: adenylate/guanylate cyclase domain-containing protein [Acidimicrobiales bacterium]